jgi:hypothetical protein
MQHCLAQTLWKVFLAKSLRKKREKKILYIQYVDFVEGLHQTKIVRTRISPGKILYFTTAAIEVKPGLILGCSCY